MASSTNPSILIKGANVWKDRRFQRLDVEICGNKICDVAPCLQPSSPDTQIIQAEGKYLTPGFVDLHVHFRQPGQEYKETIASGSRAAAAGGYTTVCTMPNLDPAPDSGDTLQQQIDIINRDAAIEVIPYATITRMRKGKELVDYAPLADKVAGFSDDGSGVQDADVMHRAMEHISKTGKILAAHCEVNDLLNGGYIHAGKWAEEHGHKGICSQSEWQEVERDINLAEQTGCHLHVCHISTKESVDLIRHAKARGVKVTCETGPHYLAFCQNDIEDDGRFKMNPPIREEADREALLAGAADGTIDAIATDHAPHSADEKSRGLKGSAMGVVGLETALAATYTYAVKEGHLSLERMIEMLTDAPRRILNRTLSVEVGQPADLVIFDLDAKAVVDPQKFLSMGKSTPFAGKTLYGSIIATMVGGKTVYTNN